MLNIELMTRHTLSFKLLCTDPLALLAANDVVLTGLLKKATLAILKVVKIIKHYTNFSRALVSGQLLGLDVGCVLEATNCFSPSIRAKDEETEADGANCELEVIRCLRKSMSALIIDGQPKQMGLKEMLLAFMDFRCLVIERRA
ncbi:eukaryotic translation initiation factor 3 subunit H, partial [Tanacetum coccineum]